jgi:hypothetical protein
MAKVMLLVEVDVPEAYDFKEAAEVLNECQVRISKPSSPPGTNDFHMRLLDFSGTY